MSTEIFLDAIERQLTRKKVTKPESPEIGRGNTENGMSLKGSANSELPQVDDLTEAKNRLVQSLNRKVDYDIQHDDNKVVINVLDGETGEVIRQITQQDFVHLLGKSYNLDKNILDETV